MDLLRKRLSLSYLFEAAKVTFLRFPWAIISGLFAAAVSVYAIKLDIEPDEAKLAATLALGIPLFLATAIFRESRGLKSQRDLLVDLVFGASLLGVHYFFTREDFTNNYITQYLHVSLILHLAVSFAGFLSKGNESLFWQFNRTLFLRLLLSVIYSAVFFIGISVALATIKKLFAIEIPDRIFAQLWMISVFVLQTWYFLGGVPRIENLKAAEYPNGLRYFVQFLLIPLVSLYMVILYFYMAKILITWNWPSGHVGWLVSVMSVVGIFNLLMLDPEKESSEQRWIGAYSKIYYVLIIPLLGMLFIAVMKRFSEYGVTEQRYFLMALGILLLGLSNYFIFSKRKSIKVIPIGLFITAIITLFGPWSAYQVSVSNQSKLAEQIIKKYSLLDVAKDPKPEVPREVQKRLTSIFDYLLQNHGEKPLKKWFSDDVTRLTRQSKNPRRPINSKELMKNLGLEYVDRWDSKSIRFDFESASSYNVSGYTLMLPISKYGLNGDREISLKGRALQAKFNQDEIRLQIYENSKVIAEFDLLPLIKSLHQSKKPNKVGSKTHFSADEMALEKASSGLRMKLQIESVNGSFVDDGVTLFTLSAHLLLD